MAPRSGDFQLSFDTLVIQGGLLGADWLAKIALLQTGLDQESADYRVPKGLELRDEIARSWRIAQACFQELQSGLGAGGDPLALSERFVEGLLRDVFGFASLSRAEPKVLGDRLYPVPFFALGERVPVVIAPYGALDTPLAKFGDGRRARTAFALLQEYLNSSPAALWGLAVDSRRLRLARDNASLTRRAWIEADLLRMFTEARLPDFAALWLLIHESRFGRPTDSPSQCTLEAWREASREQGARARDKLADGFLKAIAILGQGFLEHPANAGLRAALQAGQLDKNHYFGQLLRLVYRLIFLLTAEERDLLHPRTASKAAKALYTGGYALHRLRDRAIRRSAHDRHSDEWEAVKIVFRGLSGDDAHAAVREHLALPALAGLFATAQCPDLDGARLTNRALLGALFHLAWLRESGLVRVNWRDMGPDELGYIYEGLLALEPKITQDGRTFSFADADESRGNARKTTGSYYTPDELVTLLLDSALDPVVQRTVEAHPENPVEALLNLAIVDPACGSGHFLLGAAHRLADHVARLRAGGAPTAEEQQHALRDVVRRCLYGVDANPLAVELCKVSLWMESLDPGQPLTFLESHIRLGNALLGTTRALMSEGIPDAAWALLEGDDKTLTNSLRRRNRAEDGGQHLLPLGSDKGPGDAWREALLQVEQVPDTDVATLSAKDRQWHELLASSAYEHEKLTADAWCAAFLWPKDSVKNAEAAPTHAVWRALRDKDTSPPKELIEITRHIAKVYGLFHWELAFPQVFARGGFDVVLGNPPWERVKLQEQEFFAKREPVIAAARNAAERKKLIAALPTTNPDLWREWCEATRIAQGQSHFTRESGRYPLCGKGDINTYALFAEHNWLILNRCGRAGFITPSGIVTDDTTKEYFQALVDRHMISSVYHFENEELVFKGGLDHRYRFVLLTLGQAERADLMFYARRAEHLANERRHFQLTAEEFRILNPNTRTCPTFRSRRDADLNLAIYRRAGVLWREGDPDGNPWGLRFMRMFDMANDSGLFRTRADLIAAGWQLDGNRFVKGSEIMLPLVEAKMVHHFDHRFGTYDGQTEAQANQGKLPEFDDTAHADPHQNALPRYWVAHAELEDRLRSEWNHGWLLGWRDICRSTDERTLIASIIPRVAVGHTSPIMMPAVTPTRVACLYACLSSFVLDYAARQKIGGTHLTYGYLKQLPVLAPKVFDVDVPWSPGTALADFLLPRVLELTYTAWDLQPFAQDCGDDGPPFIWDPQRRVQLRCEIDAAFFHLYGISHDDAAYILDTFPIIARAEEKEFGEYRSKRVILECYTAMADAAATGRPYTSPIGPPKRAHKSRP